MKNEDLRALCERCGQPNPVREGCRDFHCPITEDETMPNVKFVFNEEALHKLRQHFPTDRIEAIRCRNVANMCKDELNGLCDMALALEALESQQRRVSELERGEFICKTCGIRKDAEHGDRIEF